MTDSNHICDNCTLISCCSICNLINCKTIGNKCNDCDSIVKWKKPSELGWCKNAV